MIGPHMVRAPRDARHKLNTSKFMLYSLAGLGKVGKIGLHRLRAPSRMPCSFMKKGVDRGPADLETTTGDRIRINKSTNLIFKKKKGVICAARAKHGIATNI